MSGHRSTAFVGLFAASIFGAAFLIFAVQPMVGKHILPWFGGTPGVWLICLAFYQSALFLGYAYAYWLIAKISTQRQPLIHGAVFIAAYIVLPVLPGNSWKPDGSEGASGLIFGMLIANVALPFVWLASTGPLVQAWFARVFPERSPYPLYAVSNLGSLLALLSYPFLFEPRMAVSAQSNAWSWNFAGCGIAVLGCALWAARSARGSSTSLTTKMESRADAHVDVDEASDVVAALAFAKTEIDSTRRAFWILFPASAVILFMGVTNLLCLDIASVPFLWILPLSLYLITLIVCFGSEKFYPRTLIMGLAAAVLALHLGINEWGLGPASVSSLSKSTLGQVVFYTTMLFLGCMVAHGELYRLRPAPVLLTQFYLCVAAGGALGGLFVGLAAPRIFNGYYELPIGVVACWGLALVALFTYPTGIFAGAMRRAAWACALVASAAIFAAFVVKLGEPEGSETVALHRNFFGILRVIEGGKSSGEPWTLLRNGTTRHGKQFHGTKLRRSPTTYFGAATGVGLVLANVHKNQKPMNMGVIGLGIGTLAAYGREGDRIVFYEIDPEVARIATDPSYFTYLEDSRARIEIVLGDARLSLESELQGAGSRKFDLLVIDAFSSDSIPLHLLTREAFKLYDQHLRRNGVLAVHISNRHLLLGPMVLRLGSDLRMKGFRILNQTSKAHRSQMSIWVILTRSAADLNQLAKIVNTHRSQADGSPLIFLRRTDSDRLAKIPVWTDDFSNIWNVMKPVWRGARAQ